MLFIQSSQYVPLFGLATQPSSAATLRSLQAEVRQFHQAINVRRAQNLDDAIDAGRRLVLAKQLLNHGQWLPWIKGAGVDQRTARQYMSLYRYEKELRDECKWLGRPLGITEARNFVAGVISVQRTKHRQATVLRNFLATPQVPAPPKSTWWATSTDVWEIDNLHGSFPWSTLAQEDGRRGVRGQIQSRGGVYSGTYSVFSGSLTEWFLRRFVPAQSGTSPAVLDCFAGSRNRGVPASALGYRYVGVDCWAALVAEHRKVIAAILPALTPAPQYFVGDARHAAGALTMGGCDIMKFDAAITCPPYWFLEQYPSGSDCDLSHITNYMDFQKAICDWALEQVKLMKPGAPMGIVISSVRDPNTGRKYDLPGDVIRAFETVGALMWEDITLIQRSGTAAIRTHTAAIGKKLVACHERLIVMHAPVPATGKSQSSSRKK